MIEVSRAGLVTAVGNGYRESCAAIRCGIAAFEESPWVVADGPVITAPARHMTGEALGASLLGHLAAAAIRDADAASELMVSPIYLALQAPGQPGSSPDLPARTLAIMESLLGIECRARTQIVDAGPVGVFVALAKARQRLMRDESTACIIVGVDSLINGPLIRNLVGRERLKTTSNPDGLIPGEAAACLVVTRRRSASSGLWVRGLGFAVEQSGIDSGEPPLGHGLGAAMKAALQDSGCTMDDVDFRISDVTGERYGFADANYALARVLRIRKPTLELLHLMDTLGSVGAAEGACQLAYLKYAYEKGCVPLGAAFCETSADDGRRAVAIVSGAGTRES